MMIIVFQEEKNYCISIILNLDNFKFKTEYKNHQNFGIKISQDQI